MTHASALMLKDRGLIKCSGEDRIEFLQGLITNDMQDLTDDTPLYAAFLTPQGKYLFDFILFQQGGDIYIDCGADQLDDLLRRLTMFRLRAKVTLESLIESHRIWAVWGECDLPYPLFNDPRHWKLGQRAIVPKGVNLTLPDDNTHDPLAPLKREDYDVERITLGVTNGTLDIKTDKYFWLECRAEALHGVSFTKGCYIGQEQTTRMKHRTTIKKSLVPVKCDGKVETGMDITTKDGKTAGEIHSVARNVAMAYIRLKYEDEALMAGDCAVTLL